MEEFRKQVAEALKEIGFTAGEQEWMYKTPESSRQVQVNINGRLVQENVPVPSVQFRVAFVGDADVAGEPGVQTLFEVSQEGNILMEYEEILFTGDFNRFVQIFQSLFR